MTNNNNCVLVEWFSFYGKCEIKTCKYNTQVLTSGCIALERKDAHGKKLLTDRELRYYKFDNEIHVNAVTAIRKKVLLQSKKLITLYYYAQFVLNSCKLQKVNIYTLHKKLLKRFPLKLSKLNISPILLGNMLIEENFEKFKKSVKLEEDYDINDLLLIPDKKWQKILQYFGDKNGSKFITNQIDSSTDSFRT